MGQDTKRESAALEGRQLPLVSVMCNGDQGPAAALVVALYGALVI